MIQKKVEDYSFIEGAGRLFEMNPRYPIAKNDAERQKPIIIHLGDLNGQNTAKGMPKNFVPKRGRIVPSFTKYWSPGEAERDIEEAFDIE